MAKAKVSAFQIMALNAAKSAAVEIIEASNAFNHHIALDAGCPSGSLALDFQMKGGFPDSRFHIVFGPSGSGKTTLVTRAMAMAQSMGRPVIHIDAEYAADVVYMKILGLDMQNGENYVYVQPTSGDDAFRFIKRLLEDWKETYGKTRQGPLIVIDSLKALTPQAMMEDDTKNPIGLQARMFSTWMPPIKTLIGQTRSCLLAVNQVRQSPMGFGNPEIMPGGEALTFFADTILRISRVGKVEETEFGNSQTMRVNFRKSKHVTPGAVIDMRLIQGIGYDPRMDIWLMLENSGMGTANRGRYTIGLYDGMSLPEGLEADKSYTWAELSPYMIPQHGLHYATAPLYAWAANQIWTGTVFKSIRDYNETVGVEQQVSDVSSNKLTFDFTSLASAKFNLNAFKANSGMLESREEAENESVVKQRKGKSWNIGQDYKADQWPSFIGQTLSCDYYPEEVEDCKVNTIDAEGYTAEIVWLSTGQIETVPLDTLNFIQEA